MAKRNVAHKGFAAAIDEATVRRMDEGANAAIRGQQRRLTLITCARDSDTLINLARNEADCPGKSGGKSVRDGWRTSSEIRRSGRHGDGLLRAHCGIDGDCYVSISQD